MKKQLLALLCASLTLLGALNAAGCQQKEEKTTSVTTTSPLPDSTKVTSVYDEAFTYDVYKSYAEITSYIGAGAIVNIPAEVEGVPVASIGREAFAGNTTITTVILPSSVVNIGLKAFFMCSSLREISLTYIKAVGNEAFRGCALEEVQLPPILENLGKYSFAETLITEITLPKDLVRAGDYTFAGCSRLCKVTFAEGNTTITGRMFYNCSSLTEFEVPEQITTIEGYAFSSCENLTRISISKTVTTMKEGIFYNSPNVVIVTTPGSEADRYAQKYSIPVEYVKK